MKTHVKFKCALLLSLFLFCIGSCLAQQINDDKTAQPPLFIEYIAFPRYLGAALATRSQGKAVVKVKISQDGSVVAAETISGNKILGGNSIYALRMWKFNAVSESSPVRTTTVTFTYRLISRDKPLSDAISTFKIPFSVDIVEFLPEERHSY